MSTTIQTKAVIDGAGNISVHGRAGFRIPIQSVDADGAPIDLSGRALFFEVKGKFRKEVEPGALTRWLEVTQDEAALLPSEANPGAFVLLDETYLDAAGAVIAVPRWTGLISRYGFNVEPEPIG